MEIYGLEVQYNKSLKNHIRSIPRKKSMNEGTLVDDSPMYSNSGSSAAAENGITNGNEDIYKLRTQVATLTKTVERQRREISSLRKDGLCMLIFCKEYLGGLKLLELAM